MFIIVKKKTIQIKKIDREKMAQNLEYIADDVKNIKLIPRKYFGLKSLRINQNEYNAIFTYFGKKYIGLIYIIGFIYELLTTSFGICLSIILLVCPLIINQLFIVKFSILISGALLMFISIKYYYLSFFGEQNFISSYKAVKTLRPKLNKLRDDNQ